MSARKDALTDRLSRSREIIITVTGRKSGRAISIPVWFVWKAGKLYLLPVEGSDTQWYKNVLQNSSIRITSQGAERSEEHTSELQSQSNLVCRLLLEKKKHAYSDRSISGYTRPYSSPSVSGYYRP